MFFLKEETKVITLHPSYFGPNVREYLINRLNEEEEGRCTGDHFVICVMDMVDIGEGRVLPSGGHAEYTIKYRAIIWKPFRGETVDAIVTSVKPTGIFTLAGPLSVFIARKVGLLAIEDRVERETKLRNARISPRISNGSPTPCRRNTQTMQTR